MSEHQPAPMTTFEEHWDKGLYPPTLTREMAKELSRTAYTAAQSSMAQEMQALKDKCRKMQDTTTVGTLAWESKLNRDQLILWKGYFKEQGDELTGSRQREQKLIEVGTVMLDSMHALVKHPENGWIITAAIKAIDNWKDALSESKEVANE